MTPSSTKRRGWGWSEGALVALFFVLDQVALILFLAPLLATASGVAAAPWVLYLPLLAMAVPVVQYLFASVLLRAEMPDEACVQSGTVLGLHWFRFAETPAMWWTPSGEKARRVRALAPPLPETRFGAWSGPGPVPLHAIDVRAALVVWIAGVAAVVLLLGVLGMGDGEIYVERVMGMVTAAVAFCVMSGTLYMLMAFVGARVLDLLTRVSPPLRVEGTVVTVGQRRFYLSENVECTLRHGPRGAALDLRGPEDRLTIRGDLRTLHQLERYVTTLRPEGEVVEANEASKRLLSAVRAEIS